MTRVVAHRGSSLRLPDNSLRAFSAAIASGCEMIETDVRVDTTGRLVLSHDPPAPDEDPVGLTELLHLARGRIGLDLEVKEAAAVPALVDAVRDWPGDLILTSFIPEALVTVRALDESLSTGLLVEDTDVDPFDVCAACDADALLVEDALADAALQAMCPHPLWVWTVNDPRRLTRLLGSGALAGVITDDPWLAVSLRDHA